MAGGREGVPRVGVGNTFRDEAALLRAVPGAICKAGAEACYALATAGRTRGGVEGRGRRSPGTSGRDGRCAAQPGRHTRSRGVDAAAVARTGEHLLYGGGRAVGQLRALV